MRFAVSIFAALLLSAAPAMAADLCQAVTASHSQQYLLDEKSGGIVRIAKPAPFPADARAFVLKTDSTFEDPRFDIFPLGADGAGFAVHYEGSAAEQYATMFDRVKGRLREVLIPSLNHEGEGYDYVYAAAIGGVPALFLNHETFVDQERVGDAITRIVPWQDHKWGPICKLKTAAK